MDYISQLLQEHSRTNTNKIAKAIGSSETEFKKMVNIIYHEKSPLPHRAAWLLATVNQKNPEMLLPYIPLFIKTVSDFKVDGIKRNMMLVLAKHEIPEKLQGKLITICFDFVLSKTETVAVKANAMQCIANIAKQHREIIPELKAAIEDQLPKTSKAFHARAGMILKELDKN